MKLFFHFVIVPCILAALVTAAKASDDWTVADKTIGAVTGAALLADWRQTQKIGQNCRAGGLLYEKNPIIGHCPSNGRVNAYFAASMVGTFLIADALPGNWRKGMLIGVGAVETAYVRHNDKLGLLIFAVAAF